MQRYRDACNARRAASDLLSWSLGAKPRHGHNYDPEGYKAPKNPAMQPSSAADVAAGLRGRIRYAALTALRPVLLWWLSFDQKK